MKMLNIATFLALSILSSAQAAGIRGYIIPDSIFNPAKGTVEYIIENSNPEDNKDSDVVLRFQKLKDLEALVKSMKPKHLEMAADFRVAPLDDIATALKLNATNTPESRAELHDMALTYKRITDLM